MNLKLKMILFSCLATWLICPIAFAEKEIPGNFKSPAAVKEVLSGKRTVANAAWWGFNKEDSTVALQAAINSGASKVIVPYMGDDWIVRPIRLVSNQRIIFKPGVVVTAKKGAFGGKNDCLFQAVSKNNIILSGYGATLRMRKDEYMAIPRKLRGEWRHVIGLRGSNRIAILGLTLKDSGGDGIYVGDNRCERVLIRDVTCDNNYRNAISVTNAAGLLIEGCVLKNTTGSEKAGGRGPAAGIDFEPFKSHHRLENIVMRNCVVEGNGMYGIVVHMGALRSSSSDVDVLIEDCDVRDNAWIGLYVSRAYDNGPDGLIKFKNVKVHGSVWGTRIRSKSSQRVRVVFENCIWTDTKRTRGAYPVNIYLPKEEADKVAKPGGIEFSSCQIFDAQNRPAVKYTGVIKPLHNISGNLYVKNDKRKGNLFDWSGAKLNNITIKTHLGVGAFIEKSVGPQDPNCGDDIQL